MNRIFTFYLLRQLLFAFLFATGAVTFVVLFTQSFRLVSAVIENAASMMVFLKLLGLSALTFLPLVIPLGLGTAIVFVYNKMAMDSELVVMRAAGVSLLRLTEPALFLAGAVTILCGILTLWVTPAANRALVAQQYDMRNSYAIFLSRPGSFNDLSDGLTFYANKRGPGGTLQGILIQDVREPGKALTTMAAAGQIVETDANPQMVIFNGRRQEFDRETGKLSELVFDQYILDLDALRKAKSDRFPLPRELPLSELISPSPELLKTRGPMSRFYSELHMRLATPFLSFSYTLVALASILCGAFNRRGMTGRILIGATVIIVTQASFMTLSGLVARDDDLSLLLYVVVMVPTLLGAVFLSGDFLPHRSRLARWLRKVLP
ncbi:MAG: LptF/LptG family permease [Alphaproteobacteria bacterium]|nr:LptF/LptG family permease [Alphaproteobacteria bacterium]